MKMKRKANEGAREEWEDLKRHWTASRKPKGQREFDQAGEWNKAHPEITCDGCGYTSRNEDYFEVVDGKLLCDRCREDIDMERGVGESRKAKAKPRRKWWLDIPGAKYHYHGDWSDPEIVYKGFSFSYWDVEEGLLAAYREEHPEDKDDKGFDAWLGKQGGKGGFAEGELDNLVYAALGDDGVEEKEWLGIPEAYKVKEVYGQGDGPFILFHDILVDISEFEYYDEEYDDWYPYTDSPEKFEAYYGNPANKTELITRLKESIMTYRDKSLMDESWLGDKAKAGWNAVKSGVKKVGKAIGDAFKGPFRRGDHIVMKGEDGKSYKGTVQSYNLGDQTYEVMLGNAVNEGLEEDVLDMPDRVDELEKRIGDLWWDIGGDVDEEVVMELIRCYVKLEQIEPGKIEFLR